jgi:hypothetical protein
MPLRSLHAAPAAPGARRLLTALATLALLPALLSAQAQASSVGSSDAPAGLPLAATVKPPNISATVELCTTEGVQAERKAIFAGVMSAIPGSARMEMRIDLLERGPGEAAFHAVVAPGLGLWRTSALGVGVYRYNKKVIDLAGPAVYRGAVRFRWLNAKGRLMRTAELRTPRCAQPATVAAPQPATVAAR